MKKVLYLIVDFDFKVRYRGFEKMDKTLDIGATYASLCSSEC